MEHNVYLITGLAADGRLFKNLELTNCKTHVIDWITPFYNESLENYARRLAQQIDVKNPFSLIGVSFGGMCAIEIAKIFNPHKTILISSLKSKSEMPFYFKLLRWIPIYKILPEVIILQLSILIKHLNGTVNKVNGRLFIDMLLAAPKDYLKGAIHCIVNWINIKEVEGIIHLHGDKDRVLPYKKISDPITIKGGNHFMVMNKAKEISRIINDTLIS